jgi:hypothetical protein
MQKPLSRASKSTAPIQLPKYEFLTVMKSFFLYADAYCMLNKLVLFYEAYSTVQKSFRKIANKEV